jgi:hypothetical protein
MRSASAKPEIKNVPRQVRASRSEEAVNRVAEAKEQNNRVVRGPIP